MGVRWSDEFSRSVDHRSRGCDAGSTVGMVPRERTANTAAGDHHIAADSRRSAGAGVGSSARPDPQHLRQLSVSDRVWLAVATVLLLGGMADLACHHEADGLGCADKSCEVTP
jgi:hypothetical protein